MSFSALIALTTSSPMRPAAPAMATLIISSPPLVEQMLDLGDIERADDRERPLAAEQPSRQCGDVLAGDGLDTLDELVDRQDRRIRDLRHSEARHAVPRALEPEHQLPLHALLRAVELLGRDAVLLHLLNLGLNHAHDLLHIPRARAGVHSVRASVLVAVSYTHLRAHE